MLDVYGMMSEKVILGFVLVILAVVFCTSVVAQEVEDKTIVYLLTRPIPRFRILTVKFLPALFVTLVTVWLALILAAITAFGPSHLTGTPVGRDLAIAPIGVLAYGTVFLLLSTLVNRPLIFGLLYTFGWETWVPNLPGNFQKLSLMAYLRVLAPHADTSSDEVDITQALSNVTQDAITKHLAWTALISVIIISFGLALFAFSTREYVPRDAE
jgi:ABC-2 type transport system permease protein